MVTYKQKWFLFAALAAIFFFSSWLRFYHLSAIKTPIFDEIYFPVFAHDYLTHTDFFDAHPPLGKLIIAVGIRLFGNNPFGWRVMDAVAGLALLIVVYNFAYDLTKRWQVALLALFIVAIEPMALVESREGLINIYLALFTLTGLWFFWRWWEKRNLYELAVSLLFMSMAIAVKWIGIGALGAAILFLLIQKLRGEKLKLQKQEIALLLIVPAVYLFAFIPDIRRGQDIVWWHTNAYNYHAHLKATHPYGSNWWTWAIVLRPIWLYYQAVGSGKISGIIDIGNIVTWIAGLFAMLYALVSLKQFAKERVNAILFLIITYLTLYLPWIAIGRVKFIYHYFDPVLLLLILLAIVVDDTLLTKKENRWYGITLLVAATIFFIYFIPLLIGYPITQTYYQQHMWLRSWI